MRSRLRFYRMREPDGWRDWFGALWCRVAGHDWMLKYDRELRTDLCVRCRHYGRVKR